MLKLATTAFLTITQDVPPIAVTLIDPPESIYLSIVLTQ